MSNPFDFVRESVAGTQAGDYHRVPGGKWEGDEIPEAVMNIHDLIEETKKEESPPKDAMQLLEIKDASVSARIKLTNGYASK